MIIHIATKSVETRLDDPSNNFGGYANVFVVDDFSNLGKKVLEYAPHFEYVLNSDGALIDVTPTEKPPTEPGVKSETTLLQEENEALKLRLTQAERLAAETNVTQQSLLELLIDMGVI
ncbi:MAG: hypothetical protein NHB14_20675 [Desulfosporosinus sp.]|nr:hypothetical protein [Desulfosporosinus sp.]